MAQQPAQPVTMQRSELSILAWQLHGLYRGLLDAQAKQAPVGEATTALVRKVDQDVSDLFSGRGVLEAPDWEAMSFGDLITRAAILRSTIAAYLSTDELDAQKKAIDL